MFNVVAVCLMFYIIFAILCVNYFQGILMSCQGDAFDALPGEVVSFLEDPLPWSEMSSGQREWFGPLSNVSEALSGNDFSSIGGNLSTSAVEYCDAITDGLWPDAAGCCSAWPTSAEEAPTSYEVPVRGVGRGADFSVGVACVCFESPSWRCCTNSTCRRRGG